jgi:nicotinamidase-related amidase
MRLPSDAALILVDLQLAIDDARWGPRNNPGAERTIAALLAAWREEGLPIVHIRHDSVEPDSPYRPDRPSHAFKPETAPRPGEAVVGKTARSAFVGAALEETLDGVGATTLVICGALTHNSVEATARHAADLGYRVFVVADACWAVALADGAGGLWPAEIVHRVALACLAGEYAAVVDGETALAAARLAKTRLRSRANSAETGG